MQRLLSANHTDAADGFSPDNDQLVPPAQGIVNVTKKLFQLVERAGDFIEHVSGPTQ